MQRRTFIKSLLAAGAFPLLPGCLSTAKKPMVNGKVRLAAIGIGSYGWRDLREFAKNEDLCEIVALCDVDMEAQQTLDALKAYPSLPRYRDFRKMFDEMESKIDAVFIAIPDHAHFCAAIHAMRLGKAVYVETPLAHTFVECELLMAAERKYGVVCQMGNQGQSGNSYYQYRDYASAGLLDGVTKVVAHMNNGRRWHKRNGRIFAFPKPEKIPETLDWDSWLSSVYRHDYSRQFTGGEWRCWFDFGDGCIGDWGSHILDTVHRFTLNGDLPTEVKIANVEAWNPYMFPIQDTITMSFPGNKRHGDVSLEWWEGLDNIPKPPEGYLYDLNAGLSSKEAAKDKSEDVRPKSGKEIYLADGTVWHGFTHDSPLKRLGSKAKLPDYETANCDHWRNFLLAVKGEAEARCPFSVAAPLTQVLCLGVIAQRLNRGFTFDPDTKTIPHDPVANMMLRGFPVRKEWEEYYRQA